MCEPVRTLAVRGRVLQRRQRARVAWRTWRGLRPRELVQLGPVCCTRPRWEPALARMRRVPLLLSLTMSGCGLPSLLHGFGPRESCLWPAAVPSHPHELELAAASKQTHLSTWACRRCLTVLWAPTLVGRPASGPPSCVTCLCHRGRERSSEACRWGCRASPLFSSSLRTCCTWTPHQSTSHTCVLRGSKSAASPAEGETVPAPASFMP